MTRPSYPPRSAGDLCGIGEVPRPVFGVDIDGTLGQYHEHFTEFASAYLGKELPSAKEYRGGSFHYHLGLSKSTYRKIKLAYRRGGIKRSMPVFTGASDLVSSLRKRGAIVVLCTTRPYLTVENIDEDTRHWAKRNRIQNDGIIWGPHKYRDLVRAYGVERVLGILDDEPEMVQQASALGVSAILRKRIYNEDAGITWRYGLSATQQVFEHWLKGWEMNRGSDYGR